VEKTQVTVTITIDGQNDFDIGADVTEHRRRIGMIAQFPNPLSMSIYDNIAYGPRIHGMKNRRELDAMANAVSQDGWSLGGE